MTMQDKEIKRITKDILSRKDVVVELNKKLFPLATEESQKNKFMEEFYEAVSLRDTESEDLLYELADCLIVALGMNRFNPMTANLMIAYVLQLAKRDVIDKLPEYIDRKLEINKKRHWVIEDGVYRHEVEE